MRQVIIFDCDGTLVDSETIGVGVLAEVAAEGGATFSPTAALEHLRGLKMTECVERIEELCGVKLSEDFVPQVRLRMAEAFRLRLQPMAGARELLASLTTPFCVASSGPRAKIELSLSLTGLAPLVDGRIFSSYEVGSWKPEPGIFLHAAAAMGVAPSACTVVEDSEPGVRAGLAAGMRVLAYGDFVGNVAQRHGVPHVRTHRELADVLR
ncbi:MAG: sugar transferase [Polyangiaceae bacterium]|jgi:HAD superfamily hydrolase (TIGR01509 family)|nr:sugar transferase [Polyangiaceae bacterium]